MDNLIFMAVAIVGLTAPSMLVLADVFKPTPALRPVTPLPPVVGVSGAGVPFVQGSMRP